MPMETLHRAHCDRCHSVESCMWADREAASAFARSKGWVIDFDRVICPQCDKSTQPHLSAVTPRRAGSSQQDSNP